MVREKDHIVSHLRGNNPFANRFDNLPPKSEDRFPRVAYVLQGGGALGAYQFGVVKGLLEAGYEPDWIAATSIGAIQAAIIVGNPPEKRIERLEQFWDRVAPSHLIDFLGESLTTLGIYNKIEESLALSFGQPDFFLPVGQQEICLYGESQLRLVIMIPLHLETHCLSLLILII